MNFKDMDIRTWFFPTICFLTFCYGMAFVIIYTYTSNTDVSLFSTNKAPSETTDINQFKTEMLKQIKKIN